MCMEMYLDGSLRKVVLSEEYHIGFQCQQGYTNVSSFGVGNRFWTSVKCVLWLISSSFSNVDTTLRIRSIWMTKESCIYARCRYCLFFYFVTPRILFKLTYTPIFTTDYSIKTYFSPYLGIGEEIKILNKSICMILETWCNCDHNFANKDSFH